MTLIYLISQVFLAWTFFKFSGPLLCIMKFLILLLLFFQFFSAVKAKNVVTLSVDDIFAQPGIGVPGVSSTDTNHGLFIGGHPRTDRLTGLRTDTNYVGCIKNIVIENKPLQVRGEMLKGDIMSHVCPMT